MKTMNHANRRPQAYKVRQGSVKVAVNVNNRRVKTRGSVRSMSYNVTNVRELVRSHLLKNGGKQKLGKFLSKAKNSFVSRWPGIFGKNKLEIRSWIRHNNDLFEFDRSGEEIRLTNRMRSHQNNNKVEDDDESSSFRYPRLAPKTPGQARYADALDKFRAVVVCGPTGTGKTILAVSKALELLQEKEIDTIITTRPLVNIGGESLGHLPGGVDSKIDPYAQAVYGSIEKCSSTEMLMKLRQNDRIVFEPLAYIRGRTFSRTMIIADEMQNAGVDEIQALVSRCGPGSRIVLAGDPTQRDLHGRGQRDGLLDLKERIATRLSDDASRNQANITLISLSKDDIVRDPLLHAFFALYDENPHQTTSNNISAPVQSAQQGDSLVYPIAITSDPQQQQPPTPLSFAPPLFT